MSYSIRLESKNELISICFGYLQTEENKLFLPIAVGLASDGVYIYLDHVADEVSNNVYKYKAKRVIDRLKIDYIFVEHYTVDLEWKEYGRLVFIMRGKKKETFTFYYKVIDEKAIDDFLDAIKETYHIDVKHKTIKKYTLT